MAKCSKCGAFERERMLLWCLQDRLPLSVRKVLHFAPSRRLNRWLDGQKRYEITNTDLEPKYFKYAKDVVAADIRSLPFDDNAFDCIICSHVMEHIDDDVTAFRELDRVLGPNGTAFLMVPLVIDGRGPIEDPTVTSREDRLKHFGQEDHVRIYDTETFVSRANEAGLNIEVFDPHQVDPIKAVAFGIGQGNAVFVAR